MSALVIAVIRTDLERRGDGIAGDPIRRLTQYWSLDGDLLAEVDPMESLKWARQARIALADCPDGTDAAFAKGWYAARDAVDDAFGGCR